MTDATELAQRMKAAALNATPGRIGDRIDGTGSIKYQCFGNDGSLVLQTDHKNMEYGFIGPNSKADELFFRECSPENVQVLAEALEARDKQIDILRQDKDTVIDTSLERINKILSRAEAAEKRIAELEAKEPDLYLCRVKGDEELYSPCGKDYPRGRGYFVRPAARTLVVKLPEAFYPDGDIDCPLAVNLDDVKEMLQGIGVAVEGE